MEIINEMAFSRSDILLRCLDLGPKFVEHYVKCIKDLEKETPKDFKYHANEMQSFWDKVRNLTYKSNKKKVSNSDLFDGFLTCGGNIEDRIKDEDIAEMYDKFIVNLLQNRDQLIVDLLDPENKFH